MGFAPPNFKISQGFMPHHPGFPVSRDWEDITCLAVGCEFNTMNKCVVPSIAKIGDDGRCKGFKIKGSKAEKESEITRKIRLD